MRHAFRSLRRNPAFAAMAILLMAFGIGGATILFSVFDALMLRPLPAAHPEQLVRMIRSRVNIGARSDFPRKFYESLTRDAKSFAGVGATFDENMPYQDGPRIERARLAVASESFFKTFGVLPASGTAFTDNDATAVLISHAFWQRRYDLRPDVIGRKVLIRNAPFEIRGVLPEGFNGAQVESGFDGYMALAAVPRLFPTLKDQEVFPYFEITARLAPGCSLAAARQEAEAIYRRSLAESSQGHTGVFSVEAIERGVSRFREQSGGALTVAMGASGLLLLMACANLSGLMLARFTARDAEFALRRALGASGASLFRLAFFEALTLSGGAALLAAILITITLPLIRSSLPPVRLLDTTMVPMALALKADWRVWFFSLSVTMLAAVLMSAMPALRARSQSLEASLRTSRSSGRLQGRSVLVALQVALCTLLAMGAMLTLSTLKNLRDLDPGFAKDQVASFSIDPTLRSNTTTAVRESLVQWQAELEGLPGVRSVAFSGLRLLRGSGQKTTIAPAGVKAGPSDSMNASMHQVSYGYFGTMGIALRSGRLLNAAEYAPPEKDAKGPRPVVVNEAFARRFFPGQDALGRTVGSAFRGPAKAEDVIVGIVQDAKYRSLREPVPPTIYSAFEGPGLDQSRFVLLVRTEGSAKSVFEAVRKVVQRHYPEMPVLEAATLAEDVEASLWIEKTLAALATAFAGLAIAIAGAGLYALLSYLVILRRREIGIRLAVGAQRTNILSLVLRESALPVGLGLAIGLAVSAASAPLLESIVFGVSARNATALLTAAMIVGAAAASAIVLPALHALRVSPASVLRDAG